MRICIAVQRLSRKWVQKKNTPWLYQPSIVTAECGDQTGVAKHVLAFDGLCGARTGGGCQNVRQSQRGLSNGGRQIKRANAFDSLCGGRTGVPKCPSNSTISAELERGLENVY